MDKIKEMRAAPPRVSGGACPAYSLVSNLHKSGHPAPFGCWVAHSYEAHFLIECMYIYIREV